VLALDQRHASTVEQLPRAWANEGKILHAPSFCLRIAAHWAGL